MKKVLVLGGYGNFGWRICHALAKAEIPIVVSGRNQKKADRLAEELSARYGAAKVETACFDIYEDLAAQLQQLRPCAVVNTCGPFQMADYGVAKECIAQHIHYIDLADGRGFVTGIATLDKAAKAAGVAVISGASTVPGLSSAVLDHYKGRLSEIDSLTFGIAPGQKADRGLATTEGILSYVGKPLKPFAGVAEAFGWQDLYRQDYPEIGARWMANCEIPDLDLLPERYGIKSIRFSAGAENPALHFSIWFFSWLVRAGMPLDLAKHASFFWKASMWFNFFGTDDGGMHMLIKGLDHEGKPKEIKWFIIGKAGDGPFIPTIPAIILAKKAAAGALLERGAMACVGLVSLEDYLSELSDKQITIHEA